MFIGVDLGSTNIKAAIYNRDMMLIDRQSRPVEYIRENGFVEFNAVSYAQQLVTLLADMVKDNKIENVDQISFTGQAESLVILDRCGRPLMNAISWMDERSVAECDVLAQHFDTKTCEAVTGQMAVLPTWPATKILWLKNNRPDVYDNAATYMLLKDYIVYYLTGVKIADMSIATFSFYFDIYKKKYWDEMLKAIGITEEKLPKLCEPCTVAGPLLPEIANNLGIHMSTKVNVGTLDHFAGMIGTGNTEPGGITLSTGTVMALTAMATADTPHDCGIAMHYGFLPDTHIMLPVAESGGVSLEWFKRSCMGDISYDEMNATLAKRQPNDLLFLPYLVGTNAPDFDPKAKGVFWGLRQEYDAIDMAGAVMEGVAYLLRKNCDHIASNGVKPHSIIATGGGAKSAIWCQLQADITGLPVFVPKEKEAACLGAALIAAVNDGRYISYKAAAAECVAMERSYKPAISVHFDRKYRQFCALYEASLKIAEIN